MENSLNGLDWTTRRLGTTANAYVIFKRKQSEPLSQAFKMVRNTNLLVQLKTRIMVLGGIANFRNNRSIYGCGNERLKRKLL